MSQIYSASDLASLLYPVFSRYNLKRAVLFGSYAKGTPTEKSDIDLLVDSGLRGLRFIGLTEDIKRTVGKDVDILDVTHIERNSRIEQEISATGVTLYEK